jgi:DNA polymerase bacteriophage-type
MTINLDFETFNEFDIKRGAFGYAADPSLDILCFSFKLGGNAGRTHRWTPEQGPVCESQPELCYRIKQGEPIKAWNAGFELLVSNTPAAARIQLPGFSVQQMRDSAARAASLALPRKMENCARVLKLPVQKDMAGSKVMLQLTRPHKPTKKEPWTRYTPANSPEKFLQLYGYCDTDVDTEAGIDAFLGPLSDYEQTVWELDFLINARGVPVDAEMAAKVCALRDEYNERLTRECVALCGIEPLKPTALLDWVNRSCGFTMPVANDYGTLSRKELPGMDKDYVNDALRALDTSIDVIGAAGGNMTLVPYNSMAAIVNRADLYPVVRRVLEIRRQVAQTSVKKFDKILDSRNADNRIRGMFLYWGAGPGRWAGRVVQLQNLKKPVIGLHIKRKNEDGSKTPFYSWNQSLELARSIKSYDLPTLERLYDKPIDALSSIIRPAICAPAGYELIVADYSSIEARVISWFAKEEWRLEVFATHGKIYEATASKISGIPFELIGKESKERQSGKVAELALGFQGGVKALIKMGAIDTYGLKYAELNPLKKAWREANPKIAAMWNAVSKAVESAMLYNCVIEAYGCRFGRDGIFFHIQLPSGRMLTYVYPRLEKSVRVWNEDEDRFENYNPQRHPSTPHQRVRINPETGQGEAYIHEGFRPQEMTEFVFEGEDSMTRQWVKQKAYGGKFVENMVQGVAACLLRNGLFQTEAAGYQNVLHVHDEGGALVRLGWGSVEEYEQLMCAAPPWAEGLPIAAEGWRGDRYHK